MVSNSRSGGFEILFPPNNTFLENPAGGFLWAGLFHYLTSGLFRCDVVIAYYLRIKEGKIINVQFFSLVFVVLFWWSCPLQCFLEITSRPFVLLSQLCPQQVHVFCRPRVQEWRFALRNKQPSCCNQSWVLAPTRVPLKPSTTDRLADLLWNLAASPLVLVKAMLVFSC